MKRLLVSLTYYWPNISGLSIYAKSLAEGLSQRGYQVTVLTSQAKGHQPSENINKVVVKRLWGVRLGKGIIMPTFPLVSFIETFRSEIVHCHLPSLEAWWLAWWAIILGKKLVVTYHCYFDSKNKWLNRIVAYLEEIVLTKASRIVVNSFDYIEGYHLLEKWRAKAVEIWPPITIHKSRQTRSLNRIKTIGFLGRYSREKQLEVLIKAFDLLPNDYRLLLAGPRKVPGEESYAKMIGRLIKDNNRIRDMGEIKDPTDFFQMIGCLVLPSNNRLESFGMVSAEAINNGIPVVASNTPGARVPVIASKMGELFEPGDERDLAKKIIKVLKTKYVPVDNMFNINSTLDSYDDLLQKL